MKVWYVVAFLLLTAAPLLAEESGPGAVILEERDRIIRERYEQVLRRDPLQEAAFDRVYESYLYTEGIDHWLETLKPAEGATESVGELVLQGRILARQFKTKDAVETLSKARTLGESSPAFNALLGRLYYETGRDEDAIALLGAALDGAESPEQRAELCRMLGSVYLRSGKRAEAAAVWERIAELNPEDFFALQELAEIYEENRMWDEAIAARKRIIATATNDPYRQCHAWRAIGQSLLAKDDSAGAIAAFEQGLALAAPGNWLFEDLKGRLVGVYEARGDLEGLATYLEARIAQDPGDPSLVELLADVTMRRGDLGKAEGLLKEIVARAPGRTSALEKLIDLYRQAGRVDDLAATFEMLIAQFPAEPDYLRRLGEVWLEQKSSEKALETWRRVLGDGTDAKRHALMAEWLERSEFFPEAAAAYEAALALQPDREWRLRLASLKYDMGEEAAALAAWQAAVEPADTPPGELSEIATILLGKGFKAEAETLYARAMTLEPENLDHVLAYARLLSGRDDHAGAVAQYTRLAEQDTNEYLKSEGERGLLDAYEALGTLEEQRTAWEAAITSAPQDTAARLKLARLYGRLGNRPGVVKLYEECAQIDPERIEFQRLLATAYKENHQTEQAIATLESLMEKDSGRSQAYLRELLALYGGSGRSEESIVAAEKLVELSPSSPEARTALAQVYLRSGKVEQGLQQYRDLIQLDGNQPAYYRDFGDALLGNGKFGEAQEIYRKMLDTATDDTTRIDAVGRLATVYVRNDQRDALVSEFQRRVSAAPKSLTAYQELAAVYRAAGDMKRALETLERAEGEVEDREAVLRLVMAEAYQAGDHAKVLSVYEALMERAAQPTAYDLDRLAGAYAQVGRMDEALEVWNRIARENADDATVQLLVARQLEAQGYYDESNERTERALQIDPYDYDLRFDYAQRLLGFNQVDRALEQMQKILDIGERPEAAQSAVGGGASGRPSPTPPQLVFQGGFGGAGYGGGYGGRMRGGFGGGAMIYQPGFPGGRSRRGGQSFAELRQQVVQTMVQTSRLVDGAEPMIETYRKRIEAQPENIDARRDYLLVCEASNENELALETARALSTLQPEDLSLRWRIFGYLQALGRADEAIALAIELSEVSDPNMARQARLMHIRLLAESERFDEAEAVLANMTLETPEQAQIYLQVAASFQHAADPAIADQLYQKAAELDPRFRRPALSGRARLLQERGDAAGARDLYINAVFAPSTDFSNPAMQFRSGQMPPLYMPLGGRRGRQPGNNITELPGYNYPQMDYQRGEALNQAYRLCAVPEEFAPVIARLREEAAKYGTASSDEERQEAANFVYFLVSCLRNTGENQEALDAVNSMLAQRSGDLLLENMRLFLLDEQGRYDEMRTAYSEVEASNPSVAPDVARARLQIAIAEGNVESLAALFRALPDTTQGTSTRGYGGARASQLGMVVRALENGGKRDEALALLEEALQQSRDPGILVMLSRSHAAAKHFDEAIAYAREAYEKQGGTRYRGGNIQYSMNAMTLQTQGLQGLENLWSAYRETGREAELISDFESRVEGQPTSITLRQSLIGLYMENHQYDLARTQMEKLLELRPNDVQLKVRYAGMLEANNDPAGALALLESVAASRPAAGRGIASEIRRLYKDLGKKDELVDLQERMIREARSTNDLQELSNQLAQDKQFAKAAEVLERAQRIEPESTWLLLQIGDYLWQADKKAEAVEAYLKFYKPMSPRAEIQVDAGRTPELIKRIDGAGRLGELKALAAGTANSEYSARSLKLLGALIARYEKRTDEAEQILKVLAESGPDQQIHGLLADIAEAKGDLPGAIHHLEATIAASGSADYRRIARLYLRVGDTENSVLNWKKFTGQQGGYFGNDEAIRQLADAGADDALATYFHDVMGGFPPNDPARQQFAQALIRANEDSGRFDALIDREVFAVEMNGTAELARQYAGDLDDLPGLARRRIAPIVERFPDNTDVKVLYADILQRAGDIEGAISVYSALPQDDEFYERYGDRYAALARAAGEHRRWCAFVLARAARPAPSEQVLVEACRALVETGRRGELAGFREQVLNRVDAGQRAQVRAGFAEMDAESGNLQGAFATMKALSEEAGDGAFGERYFRFLVSNGFESEAASYLKGVPESKREGLRQDVSARGTVGVLLAVAEPQLAWQELLQSMLRREQRNNMGGHQLARAFRTLREFSAYQVPASTIDGYLDSIRGQEVLSKTDRFVLASWEISRGHWPDALALLKEQRDDRVFQELIEYWQESIPEELRSSLLEVSAESAPEVAPAFSQPDAFALPATAPPVPDVTQSDASAPPAPAEQTPEEQIDSAVALANSGKKGEAVSALDAVLVGDDLDLLQRRARVYGVAGAPEKAADDLKHCLALNPELEHLRMELAMSLARAGKTDEAMTAWGEAGRSNGQEFARVLFEQSSFDSALQVLDRIGVSRNGFIENALLRARVLQAKGQSRDMVAVLESLYVDLSENSKDRLAREFATQLTEHGGWKDLVADDAPPISPLVMRTLIELLGRVSGDEKNSLSTMVASKIDLGAISGRPEAIAMSRLLSNNDQRDEAVKVLNAAVGLPQSDGASDRNILQALYNLEARDDAARALLDLSRRNPQLITDSTEYEQRVEALNDPVLRDAVFDRFMEVASTDTHVLYLRALKSWHNGDKEAAREAFLAILDAPNAQRTHLTRMIELFQESGDDSLVQKALERLSSDEYGADARNEALLNLARRFSKAGDGNALLDALLQVYPASVGTRCEAWKVAWQFFEDKPFETLEPMIIARIQASPTNPGVVDLIALRNALASQQGISVAPLDAAALGVPDALASDITLVGNLAVSWAVLEAVDMDNWTAFDQPLDDGLMALLRGEANPANPSQSWRLLSPDNGFPAVFAARMTDGFGGRRGEGVVSSFLTDIESTDDREITLAVGSGDWMKIWVNGTQVYSNPYSRVNLPDTDRVTATLHAGLNSIRVRSHQKRSSDSGIFSISIISGGEGLIVHAPVTPMRQRKGALP